MCIQRPSPEIMTGLTFRSAKELVQDPHACFKLITARRHLALLPKYIGDLSRGVREQLDVELNLYSPNLNGVMVAYSNVRRFQQYGTINGSQPYIHLDIQADFIVFQPTQGSILKAVVNKIGRDYIGCLVHGCFNASVPKQSRDGEFLMESDVTLGQTFLFQVVKYFANNGVMSIRGSFFEDSFEGLPSAEPVNEPKSGVKRKLDDLDGTLGEDDSEQLPTITHKRRRTDSAGASMSTTTENTQNLPMPNGSHEGGDEESQGRKKKKKKKKRHSEDESTPTLDTSEYATDVSRSNVTDSGIKVNNFSETSEKKSEKKSKRKHNDESIDNSMDVSQDVDNLEDSVDAGSKKKKKHKRKRDSEAEHLHLDSSIDVSQVKVESEGLDTTDAEIKKKKKKKHKHKERDLE